MLVALSNLGVLSLSVLALVSLGIISHAFAFPVLHKHSITFFLDILISLSPDVTQVHNQLYCLSFLRKVTWSGCSNPVSSSFHSWYKWLDLTQSSQFSSPCFCPSYLLADCLIIKWFAQKCGPRLYICAVSELSLGCAEAAKQLGGQGRGELLVVVHIVSCYISVWTFRILVRLTWIFIIFSVKNLMV